MNKENTIQEIKNKLGETELLLILAEECSELSKAALKLRRAITKINPTPITEQEAEANLLEEVADVLLCLRTIEKVEELYYFINITIDEKAERWLKRLKGERL